MDNKLYQKQIDKQKAINKEKEEQVIDKLANR